MSPNPKIIFVQSLLTSRIFWVQVVSLVALIATAAGFHSQMLNEAGQAEMVGALDMIATTVFRMWGTNGPVSLTAPISVPAPQDLQPGSQVVTVSNPVPTPPPPAASVTVVPHAPAPALAPSSIIIPSTVAPPAPPAAAPASLHQTI